MTYQPARTPAAAHPPDEAALRALDAADPLARVRAAFEIPPGPDGAPCAYFCGNSLGLMPRSVRDAIAEELDDWARLGVEGHLHARHPWLPYHEELRTPVATLVGGLPDEVVVMNSLTANLHLMMVSFYRPTPDRYRILIEADAFPSDSYAVASQADLHGFDPRDAVVRIRSRSGEDTLRHEDIEDMLDREGRSIALALLPGVNYLTGQAFDIARLTAAAHRAGCIAGWDLAHAVGNMPLALHDANADFAVWCSYKYLNAGPGAPAGCFVHERHARNAAFAVPGAPKRLAGWWGNDPATRFAMGPEFRPRPTADGWQLSNPPVLALAPLRASLALFSQVGMPALRQRSLRLTGTLEQLLRPLVARGALTILTPADPRERGCQLSLRLSADVRPVQAALARAGVMCDVREPNVLRAAPVPLYSTFHDSWRLVRALDAALPGTR